MPASALNTPAPGTDAAPGRLRSRFRSTPRSRRRRRSTLTRPAGLALGISVLWFSLLVMIPLALLLISSVEDGWSTFWDTLTNVQTANAIRLTLVSALAVTAVNLVMGLLIAWVLVRDRFPGRWLIELMIDIPFALPSLVAGLVLLSLYGPESPLGINVLGTPASVFLALLFVTLPFVVRTVQPVLGELDRDVERAAHSLGASRATTVRRIILPALTPALAAGATLCFARGVGEFGALVILTGNRPNISEGAPMRIQSYIEVDNTAAAATVAVLLLATALAATLLVEILTSKERPR